MKKVERLINEANNIIVKDFSSLKEAKDYSRKLHNDINTEREKLEEQVKELESVIRQLERAQSYTFSYWLNVKE